MLLMWTTSNRVVYSEVGTWGGGGGGRILEPLNVAYVDYQ